MPYVLVPYKRGWRVKSEESGRYFSKKPMSKANAIKQQRLLYAVEKNGEFKQLKGGCQVCACGFQQSCDDVPDMLDGAGLFNNIVASAKRFFSKAAKTVFTKTAEVTSKAVRQNYPPSVRDYLAKNGNGVIQNITIQRTPINTVIDKALNFLTLGKFAEAKAKYAYDKLFHLSMVCVFMIDGRIERVFIEKNEVIRMSEHYNIQKDTQIKPVPYEPGTLTIGSMMERAAAKAGPSFYTYDAFTNNCQVFINTILEANGLSTPDVRAFVMQDAPAILQELPEYASALTKTITNLGAIKDFVVSGQGKRIGNKIVMKKADFIEEHKRLLALLAKHPDLRAEMEDQRKELNDLVSKSGETVTLKYSDFMKEHKKLLALLAKHKDLKPELQRQKMEVKQYMRVKGGMPKRRSERDEESGSKKRVGSMGERRPASDYKEGESEPEEEDDQEEELVSTRVRPSVYWKDQVIENLRNAKRDIERAKENINQMHIYKQQKYRQAEAAIKAYQERYDASKDEAEKAYIAEQADLLSDASQMEQDDILAYIQNMVAKLNAAVRDYNEQVLELEEGATVAGEEAEEAEEEGGGRLKLKLTKPPVLEEGFISKNIGIPIVSDVAAQFGLGRHSEIKKQLDSLGLTEKAYLSSVRKSAEKAGIKGEDVMLADDDSKIVVRGSDGKLHKAGATGYGDFHIYKLLEARGAAPAGTALEHRRAYLARATKIKGDWKSDKYSPNSLAINILWDGKGVA